MWDRTLRISHFAKWLDMANRLLPGASKHIIPLKSNNRDFYGSFIRTSCHLSFIPEEEKRGERELSILGVPARKSFVCFHTRSVSYLKTQFPDNNWNYHSYRNEEIRNYLPAIQELTHRGYYVIRTGVVLDEPLEILDPMVIDCATKERNDFLNIFMGAKCNFYFGSGSGFNEIPVIFRRPTALVNLIPLEHVPTWSPIFFFITKKLWLRKERRFLTFREILDSKIGRIFRSDKYEQLGLEVIENTPQEITALAAEMDERLKGTWQETGEDIELQQRFWSLFKPNEINQIFVSHIGNEFLRQNRDLLK
jgi:putative glycosyltransferase (TIGR04372 family)